MKFYTVASILILLLLGYFLIKVFNNVNSRITYDYSLEITPDSIYIIDEKDVIIYKEKVQWDNPTPLQQALINNNQ